MAAVATQVTWWERLKTSVPRLFAIPALKLAALLAAARAC